MAQKTVITVKNLVKRFGDFTAVNGINLEVSRGEIFGFLGPNGSGKTTTIRILLGLMAPSEGQVEVLGIPVHGYTKAIRPQVGYMSQRFSLYNDLSVQQNLNFYARSYGLTGDRLKKRVDQALDLAGLKGREGAQTAELSGGWRQRLALGASILHRPKLLFLDEPTAGVDPISRREFWELLYQLVEEKITVFVTTHYMDEAEHCHRLAFIQRGRRIAYGSPSEIKKEMMQGEVLEISGGSAPEIVRLLNMALIEGERGFGEVELFGSLVHVVARQPKVAESRICSLLKSASIQDARITQIEPSLEDVFVASMK